MLLSPPVQAPPPAIVMPNMPTQASNASPVAIDLAQALDRAKSENALLRVAKARVDERKGLITATRADALPQVSLVAAYTRTRNVDSVLEAQMKAEAAKKAQQKAAQQAAQQPTTQPDGTPVPTPVQPPVDLTLPDVKPLNMYTTQAVLTQPLFYWGKIGTAIKIAKMGEAEAVLAYTTAELDTLHGVAQAYIAVLSAQAELEVVATRQKTAEQFLEDVKSKLEAQTATELDRLRAESEYLAVIPENLQAEANVKRAREILSGLLGLNPKTPLQLADLGQPQVPERLQGNERSEIAQFKKQEEMYEANDRIIRADLRPKFDLEAAYGYRTFHTQDQFKEPFREWKVNVVMRFPIFDGFRSAGKRVQNRAQLEQVRQLRVDKERDIAVEQSHADRELEKSIAYHDAARKAHDAGMEALRMSRESFEQGLITSLDLLQAERAERQMESQRRQAELGVWKAIFDYRRSIGLAPL